MHEAIGALDLSQLERDIRIPLDQIYKQEYITDGLPPHADSLQQILNVHNHICERVRFKFSNTNHVYDFFIVPTPVPEPTSSSDTSIADLQAENRELRRVVGEILWYPKSYFEIVTRVTPDL